MRIDEIMDNQIDTQMKKVVNVSVGGRGFSLDEDAYARLTAYFDHFRARLDRDSQSAREEVMTDLENRIAELFDQGTGGASYRVVNLALVTKVVEQLGMPDGSKEPSSPCGDDGQSGQSGTTGGQGDSDSPKGGPDFTYNGSSGSAKRHLFRDLDNKTIGGVCAGLAAFLNVDTTIVRIVALVAMLAYGTGFLVYLVLWIVVPVARTPADKCMMRGFEPTAENMARFGQRKSGDGK